MRSLAAWVELDQVPKDSVIFKLFTNVSKNRFMLYRGEAGSHFGAYGAARRSCVTGRVKLGERYETWAAEVRSKRFKENTSRFHVKWTSLPT